MKPAPNSPCLYDNSPSLPDISDPKSWHSHPKSWEVGVTHSYLFVTVLSKQAKTTLTPWAFLHVANRHLIWGPITVPRDFTFMTYYKPRACCLKERRSRWQNLCGETLPKYLPDKDFPVAQMVRNLPVMQETRVRSLGQEDPLVKGMAIHSSILAWRIPWTEGPGGLNSVGLQSQTRLSN